MQTAKAFSPRSNRTLQRKSVTSGPVKGIRQPRLPARVTRAQSTEVQPVGGYFANDKRPVILFDGVCNLCNGGVNFMLDWDPSGRFRLAALQSPAGRALLQRCGRHPEDISSIVLVEEGGCHIRSDAILRIARGLSDPLPFLALFGLPVPPFLRDAFYDQVANNRYNIFGRSNACRLSDERFESRFITD